MKTPKKPLTLHKKNLKKVTPFFNYWKKVNELQNFFELENESKNLLEVEADLALLLSHDPRRYLKSILKANIQNFPRKEAEEVIRLIQEPKSSISLILNPVRLLPLESKKSISIFKIPLIINEEGKLEAHPFLIPWIPRNFLEPAIDNFSITIAESDSYEKLLKKHPQLKTFSSNELFKYSEDFFKKITGANFHNFSLEDHTRVASSIKFKLEERNNNSIQKLFNYVSRGQQSLGSFPSLCRIIKEKKYFIFSQRFLHKSSRKHIGHFTPNFPLSVSQRSTLLKTLDLKEAEAFPIDGPPGTGKTTIIQSIVANLFVLSALKKAEGPATIVVCGATNQSVKNVIDSFNRQNLNIPLAERWLPSLSSYGLYCHAEYRADSSANYLGQLHSGEGFYKEYLKSQNLKNLTSVYLENFNKHMGSARTVKSAISLLHNKMLSVTKNLIKEQNNLLKSSWLDYFFGSFTVHSQEHYESLLGQLEPLDTKLRYLNFLLATHYWEGRWLLSVNKFLEKTINPKNYSYLEDEIWRWKAMLTPVSVSTIAMAPKFYGNRKTRSPIIDCLIFDEAGQVLPEQGAILSTLAKKVIAIGDTKQLKPYSLLPDILDEQEYKNSKLVKKSKKSYSEISELGFTSSHGSFMRLCKSTFPLRDAYGSGGALNEHRRSVPEIVDFCNTLSYHGRLIPKRPQLSDRIFPAFLHVDVIGADRKVGKSRENQEEVYAIEKWIKNNRELITNYYKKKNIQECLAVLTPFTAQARLLNTALSKRYPSLIVGTVHSLQGSERDIILFSSVYSSDEQNKFILDKDETLLNVAVSRAKDSFIVFGSKRMLANGKNKPSNLLLTFSNRSTDERRI